MRLDDNKIVFLSANPFRLDVADGTFFGVEEGVFIGICAMARSGDQSAQQVRQMEDVPFTFSGLSVLRDGSIIGPLQFFRPINIQIY